MRTVAPDHQRQTTQVGNAGQRPAFTAAPTAPKCAVSTAVLKMSVSVLYDLLFAYVPSNSTFQLLPPSVDESQNWRTFPPGCGVHVIR